LEPSDEMKKPNISSAVKTACKAFKATIARRQPIALRNCENAFQELSKAIVRGTQLEDDSARY